ncbi:DUF4247 domain-containing protein [Halobacillus sp. ACCC02827]|uniref:DUF4247 domain-containing protein n=1 Tax=Bacillaceae TaxID=186817 RepID=UPI0002A4D3D4|nr:MULTISPECIES: DUF4247 domain-containing protein [Bacillaceae]ELK47299.1 hypothetical protein D479_07617 [Halobacillus sp. BAB-2008]QHT47414.1 DUF4247 domain-containing protein [Bacillus sp. SB49]WJE14637.1 DUF4247 domain-containing protein [Halobacillus sp. ACCC02827]
MKNYTGLIFIGIIALAVIINLFNSGDAQRGMSGSVAESTYENLPEEPDRSEILEDIENSDAQSAEVLIRNNFPLLDVVNTDQGTSEVYATRQLSLPETADALSEAIPPEEISERQDGKQVLVYDDDFVIIQESEEEPGVVTMEIASDEFVRNNYSPSFFNGLFAGYLLNRMLGSNNWYDQRRSSCQAAGDCYGGYGSYNSGSGAGSIRSSNNRGGGPGVGK